MRIIPARVSRAIFNLHEWWQSAHSQNSKHLLPLLALLERGAGNGATVRFEEQPDEFAFWDRYFRVEKADIPKPYFNPLTRTLVELGYPHSNAATIRKNTFRLKWGAADLSEGKAGESLWTLSPSYAEIFRDKALTKGGVDSRVPALDLAVLLLRAEAFEEGSTSRTLIDKFRERFPQQDEDFHRIFVVVDEPPNELFTSEDIEEPALVRAIAETLITEPAVAKKPVRYDSAPALDDEDPLLLRVRELLALNSSGIVLKGVPGTGKTWHARQVAAKLTGGDKSRIFEVQFHPSLGYEDFVEGYRPSDSSKSGFVVVDKQFVIACKAAAAGEGSFVYIIDELNRGDPARIFGDLLTFIEHGYRGREFLLPFSGTPFSVPPNLIVIATMNPYDLSATQLDSALVRRFDHIEIQPSTERVGEFLESTGAFSRTQVQQVQNWFDALQGLLPRGLGHTYFKDVTQVEHLQLVWHYRILPVCESVLSHDAKALENVRRSFAAMYARVSAEEATSNLADAAQP